MDAPESTPPPGYTRTDDPRQRASGGFTLGLKSHGQLVGVHPALKAVVVRAIQLTEVDFGVHDGARTLAEQKMLLARGATKTLNSRHLVKADGFGHAVDLVPWIGGRFSWAEWEPFYQIAWAMEQARREQGVEITWGGIWDRPLSALSLAGPACCQREMATYGRRHAGSDFYDGPHFQLEGRANRPGQL